MHINVTSAMFADAFRRMGRENQFSREALEALFNYLEEYTAGRKAHTSENLAPKSMVKPQDYYARQYKPL